MSAAREDRSDDLALALRAARVAGRDVMRTFRDDPDVHHKGPDQPVTQADLDADATLRDRLVGARPEYGWLSEESADRPERLQRVRVWVVDPIDGTRSFVAGYPEFAISVALVERGVPVIGVIYNPAAEHVVWATAGGGAHHSRGWTGGTDAASSPELGTDTATLLASRSERAAGEFDAFEDAWEVREVGSTAWKLARVALGDGAYISRGPKSEWDVAAGVVIVDEAGGLVTDATGRAIAFNRPDPYVHGVAAGPPEAHARLVAKAQGLPSPRLHRDAWNANQ